MKKARIPPENLNLRIRGRLGNKIYQATGAQFANSPNRIDKRRQCRTQPPIKQPATPEHVQQWQTFRERVAQWQGFTEPEKEDWRQRAVRNGYKIGYNYYIAIGLRQ